MQNQFHSYTVPFQTLTGFTGVLLWAVMMAIFIFAHPLVRRNAFNFFWLVHQLYVVLYFLCLIHGLARITAEPQFWIFFLIPGIVYTLDKIVTLRTAYMELDILETELLPSDVIRVRFYRPPNMKVGIVCPKPSDITTSTAARCCPASGSG